MCGRVEYRIESPRCLARARGGEDSSGEQREEDAGPDEEARDQKQHQPRTERVPGDQHHSWLRASFRRGKLK